MKDRDSLNWEVSVGVTFGSFMSAVALFFTGAVISQYHVFDETIKIPLLFLIISTFSFIFSASIYSNAGVEITNNQLKKVERYLVYANNIFEFLGLYLFVLATPLVISAITHDSFLRTTTVAVALTALGLYSNSSFSILHKEFPAKTPKLVITLLILLLAFGLYFVQIVSRLDSLLSYKLIASLLLIVMFGVTWYFCSRSKQYSD